MFLVGSGTFLPPIAVIGAVVATSLAYTGAVSAGRIYLVATREAVTVERRPMPWPKRVVPRAQLLQLYVVEQKYIDEGNEHYASDWSLVAKVRGRKKPLKLSPAFIDPALPRYLEKQLERYLGIKDQAVRGEYEGYSRGS